MDVVTEPERGALGVLGKIGADWDPTPNQYRNV
jgi:hypothetical protein